MKKLPPTLTGRVATVLALGTAVVTLVAALRPVIRPAIRESIVAVGDSIYVRQDSARLQHLRDSLISALRADPEAAKLDTILRCLHTRRPKWCE